MNSLWVCALATNKSENIIINRVYEPEFCVFYTFI